MTVTYDPTDLTDATGQINIVRLMLGDTDAANAELQDEEIQFYIDRSPDNLYLAASFGSSAIASKYAGYVTTELDGALSADYSDLYDRYQNLSTQLRTDGQKYSGNAFGLYLGGGPVGVNDRTYTFYRGQYHYNKPYDGDYTDV